MEKGMFWTTALTQLENDGWTGLLAVDEETVYEKNGDTISVVRPVRESINNGELITEKMELRFLNGYLSEVK